jgi:hypothetical protein
MPQTLPVNKLGFSPFVTAAIHESVLSRMKTKGLECDGDIAGLTALELEY